MYAKVHIQMHNQICAIIINLKIRMKAVIVFDYNGTGLMNFSIKSMNSFSELCYKKDFYIYFCVCCHVLLVSWAESMITQDLLQFYNLNKFPSFTNASTAFRINLPQNSTRKTLFISQLYLHNGTVVPPGKRKHVTQIA